MFCNNEQLNDIYYNGTIVEWQAIKKAEFWNVLEKGPECIPATVVHCTDGDVEI